MWFRKHVKSLKTMLLAFLNNFNPIPIGLIYSNIDRRVGEIPPKMLV